MYSKKGFTIVELLMVIVVIGILAAIVIITYNGVASSAREAAVAFDARNVDQAIKVYLASGDALSGASSSRNVQVAIGGHTVKMSGNNKVWFSVSGMENPPTSRPDGERYCALVAAEDYNIVYKVSPSGVSKVTNISDGSRLCTVFSKNSLNDTRIEVGYSIISTNPIVLRTHILAGGVYD